MVVVFPFVPVTHILNELECLLANSISEIIGILIALILEMISELFDIPGLLTIKSENSILSKECLFSSNLIEFSRNIDFISYLILELSETNTL